MTQASIRVVIADDQALIRSGLKMILSTEPDIEIVGMASNGAEAIAVCEQERPDVLIIDVRMPEVGGIEATRVVTAEPDPPRVLVITTFDQDDIAFAALRAGASGFLFKDASEDQLVSAIRILADGSSLVTPIALRNLVEKYTTGVERPRSHDFDSLTEREMDVLAQLAQGLSNAEIAQALFLTENTVKTHVARVLTKLSVRDRVQAVVLAYESGLVRRQPPV